MARMSRTQSGSATAPPTSAAPANVRCAIYTRKSTDEGLDMDFNSLDAQRESAESFIASQRHEGWTVHPARYDDGGYSGGSVDRPALQQLLRDIEAGQIDCLVVYKVDRLSRSLMDFARIIEILERHNVSFVSVTQQFNSTSSMGRLTLNILLSFAQFEREIIAERTRDKMSAARRKGKWVGGMLVLGYDVAPKTKRLIVNEDEAGQVQSIFRLYIEHRSLLDTATELNRRGWTTKRWTTQKGTERGGQSFNKTNLFQLLTNITYTGKILYQGTLYEGEHDAIIDEETWRQAQSILQRNGRSGGGGVRNKHAVLLKGLIYCIPCARAMSHSYTTNGARRYRYYVCTHAQKTGWDNCPSKAVPAGQIEAFVLERIRAIGRDPQVVTETLSKIRAQTECCELEQSQITEQDLRCSLARFDETWEALTPPERIRLMHLLVERIGYDGRNETVSITFHPSGIKALANPNENDPWSEHQ